MKALFITAGGFEDMELFCPCYRLQEAGLEIDVAAAEAGLLKGIRGYQAEAGLSFKQVELALYDLPAHVRRFLRRESDRGLFVIRGPDQVLHHFAVGGPGQVQGCHHIPGIVMHRCHEGHHTKFFP